MSEPGTINLVGAPIPAGTHGQRHGSYMLGKARPENTHQVICGDNLDVLPILAGHHTGQVDLIYIDPPYNTGTERDYHDSRHDWDIDIRNVLVWSRNLLTPTGIIIVAVGDDELHRMRMLMDAEFWPENFISLVTWQGGRKNDSRFVSNSADYMLTYAKNKQATPTDRWTEPKPGVAEVLAAGQKAWVESGNQQQAATKLFQAWWRSIKAPHPARQDPGLSEYNKIDAQGRVYRVDNLGAPVNRASRSRRPLIHPETGLPCRVPVNGWRHTDATLDKMVAADQIVFGPDETVIPHHKRLLADQKGQVPLNSFTQERSRASKHLNDLLGGQRFANPKDHEVLARWFNMAAPDDALILDFYAGSGSTLEAVVTLNAQDGGTRRCILVTNNEVGPKQARQLRKAGVVEGSPEWEAHGVFENVTRPRIATLATGVREDGSIYGQPGGFGVDFLRAEKVPGLLRLPNAS